MSSQPAWSTLTPQPVLDCKASSGGGWEVTGYASVFDVVDLGNDVVHKGAFADSLGRNPRVRFLYSHDPQQVIGAPLSLAEDEQGLLGHWRLSKTRLGEEVHTLLEDGALDSFSIGYRPRDHDVDKQHVRHLKAIDLYEVSLVAMPMLPDARVTGFKTDDYASMGLDTLLATYADHRGAALAQAKAIAERRLAEGRKLSDSALVTLERLRTLCEDDAAELLRLATSPPLEKDEPPAPVETVGPLVEAHLRRARLRELRHAFGMEP